MLKLFFWLLLAANGLLFAYQQGYLETLLPSGHEPARMRNQLNADKIRLIKDAVPNASMPAATVAATETGSAAPAPAASAASSATAGSEKTAQAAVKPGAASCAEIGNFTGAEAKRFEAKLAALPLAGKFSRQEIKENSTHMIFIPPEGGKEGADKRVAELRRLEVSDFYVIQDRPGQRWGISLGIFKNEEAARARLEALTQKGIQGAQLVEFRMSLNRFAFQLHAPDAAATLDKLKASFPRQEVRDCALQDRKEQEAGAPAVAQFSDQP